MIGEILNKRYRILRVLGTGRCGKTFLAEDIQLNCDCVIKQFEPEAKDTLSLRKAKYLFAREVKILKILGRSDRIPDLLNYFRQGEKFYLVHEFVAGNDLAQELGQYPWNAPNVLGLLREILEIVEVAHHEQVIHQDIKPSNIIRRQADGQLVLIDFGSIKKINNQMANAEGNTCISVPIGTQGYMAPEQKSIKPRLASDIYSIGMICIYALTGIEPQDITLDHDTETVQWRNLIQVDANLAQVLDRMVSCDLNQRYASASEALAAVRKLKLGGKLLDFKTVVGASTLLLIVLGGGLYYWRLESSLNRTSEIELFAAERTKFSLVYRHPVYGVSMTYPPGWKLNLPQPESKTIAQFTPERGDSWSIIPTVTIEVAESDAESLDDYTTNSVYEITQLPKAKIIDSRPVKVAGSDGHKVVYTLVDANSGLEQKYLQFWTLRNSLVYAITYEAAIDDYPNFVGTVQQDMIGSLEIEPKARTGSR
ncbi:MAG: serine/threonine-protein kinase [Cyanobacteria bacterium P01_C01_bin.72]